MQSKLARRYMSWFSRNGVRLCAGTGTTWGAMALTATFDNRPWVAAGAFAASVGSFYTALVLHDNPPDLDDPAQDYF